MLRSHGITHYTPDTCYGCKLKTIQIGVPAFQPHYNYAVGQYVTSWADFNDKLRRLGDIQSERTGISSTYETVHPADLRASPPPEAAPSHLPRLVAHDEDGRALHDPVDGLPTAQRRQNDRNTATQDARTKDLIPHEPDD